MLYSYRHGWYREGGNKSHQRNIKIWCLKREGTCKKMTLKTGEKVPKPKFELIPIELKCCQNWLLWKAKPMKDKPEEATKIPVTMKGKAFSGWNDPKNLYSFDDVEKAFKTGNFDGVGFVLAGTDFICIDLDNNISTENISDELLDLLGYGYTEISPSGKGYHVWIRGDKPKGMGKNGHTAAGEKLEVFGGRGWVTVTGDIDWAISSLGKIRENQSLINNLYKSYFRQKHSKRKIVNPSTTTTIGIQNLDTIKIEMFKGPIAQKIRKLWNGDTSMYRGDHSFADLALCSYLVSYTKGDSATVDALFRQSGLYRTKWDEKRGNRTYGAITISKALESKEDYRVGTQTRPIRSENDAKLDIEPVVKSGIEVETGFDSVEILEVQRDFLRSNNVERDALLEYIKTQEEFNRSLVERLGEHQSYFEECSERNEHDRKINKSLNESLKETQKQYQQIIAAQVTHNERSMENYTLLLKSISDIIERQESLEELSKQLLKRLDEQQEYINNKLEQRALQLTIALKEMELKKNTTSSQGQKKEKTNFFARLFKR